MSQSVIQAIVLSCRTHIADCYVVVGSYVGQLRSLKPYDTVYEEIEEFKLKLIDCQNRIELWSYQPQKLIQKWQIQQNALKPSQLCSIVENQKWQIMIKLGSSPQNNHYSQKLTRHTSQCVLTTTKTNSKSTSKSKSKNRKLAMVKSVLKQKINLLTVKPQRKAQTSEPQKYYYSSCSQKYPSFFSNNSNTHYNNYKSCLDICAQNKNKLVYNTEALSIYGFDGPKQVKLKQNKRHGSDKYLLKGLC